MYEELLKEADNLQIIVRERKLKAFDGLCKGNRIAISKDLITDAEKYCVLHEEIGHFLKTVGDITDQTKIENRKQELVARRYGYKRAVSLFGLVSAFEYKAQTSYEIAEFLGVTEQYLKECIEDYKKQYGVYCMLEQYIIYFEPNLMICKLFNPVV